MKKRKISEDLLKDFGYKSYQLPYYFNPSCIELWQKKVTLPNDDDYYINIKVYVLAEEDGDSIKGYGYEFESQFRLESSDEAFDISTCQWYRDGKDDMSILKEVDSFFYNAYLFSKTM